MLSVGPEFKHDVKLQEIRQTCDQKKKKKDRYLKQSETKSVLEKAAGQFKMKFWALQVLKQENIIAPLLTAGGKIIQIFHCFSASLFQKVPEILLRPSGTGSLSEETQRGKS